MQQILASIKPTEGFHAHFWWESERGQEGGGILSLEILVSGLGGNEGKGEKRKGLKEL